MALIINHPILVIIIYFTISVSRNQKKKFDFTEYTTKLNKFNEWGDNLPMSKLCSLCEQTHLIEPLLIIIVKKKKKKKKIVMIVYESGRGKVS